MRKIGLDIMGLAQLYIQLGVQYGSEAGNEIVRQLMTHINHESKWTSHDPATERGVFTDWDDSKYANLTEYAEWFEHHTGLDAEEWADGFLIRNHNTTTIAPPGPRRWSATPPDLLAIATHSISTAVSIS